MAQRGMRCVGRERAGSCSPRKLPALSVDAMHLHERREGVAEGALRAGYLAAAMNFLGHLFLSGDDGW